MNSSLRKKKKWSTVEVKENLEAMNYRLRKITRMKQRNGALPMVLVDAGREYRSKTVVDS